MNTIITSFFILLSSVALSQPSKLQLIEEQIEAVIMVQCVAYEKGTNGNGQLTDISIYYTGSNTIDAKEDSGFYYVYGKYNFDKYTNVNAQVFGNLPNQSFNKSGSRAYIAKVKEVLGEYRVQEIIIVFDTKSFDFENLNFEELSKKSDLFYPDIVKRERSVKKDKKKNKTE